MKKSRFFITMAVMFVMTLLLAGCNKGSEANDGPSVFSGIVFVFVGLITFFGHMHWRAERQEKRIELKSDVDSGIEEGDALYLYPDKKEWSGSPWEGNPYLGGLMVGFSPLAFYFPIFLFVMLATKNDIIASVAFLFVYFTWVCFRQNRRALKIADQLAKGSLKPKEIYNKAYDYPYTKFAMWMAPWLGAFYYRTFKERMKNAPDYRCPSCGEPIEKDVHYHLPEVHMQESMKEVYRFEAFRCQGGHEFVIVEKGEQFGSYYPCSKCNALLLKKEQTEVIRNPSFWRWGLKRVTYSCMHCGDTYSKTYKIGWVASEEEP